MILGFFGNIRAVGTPVSVVILCRELIKYVHKVRRLFFKQIHVYVKYLGRYWINGVYYILLSRLLIQRLGIFSRFERKQK